MMHLKSATTVLSGGLALLAATFALATPVYSQGAQGEMFRRHFFRGQAYHGEGYAAQVGELGDRAPHPAGAGASFQAEVEPGTPAAAVARTAAVCAARFKSYDASTGTYVGRGGRLYRCR